MSFPWQQFHFLRPEWFLTLIPMLLIVLAMRYFAARQSGWQGIIPPHLYHHLMSSQLTRKGKPPLWLLPLGWLLAVTALAGPAWERLPQPVFQLKTGHVVVMDMSLSMRATDVGPDRLTRAKYKAIDLIHEIDEGEIGLVAYSGDAFVISPLTSDGNTVTALIPSLSPEIMPVTGSDPLLGIQQAATLLSNAGYQQGSIYWITDGIERDQVAELQSAIRDIPYRLSVLAVGTEDGAPIRQQNGELLKQQNGAIVIPKTDLGALSSLASLGGGHFSTLTADDSDVSALARLSLRERGNADTDEGDSQAGDQWREFGPYLLLALLPIAAYAFRRGVVFALAFCLVLPGLPNDALAQTSAPATEASLPEEDSAPSGVAWWKAPFLNADQTGKASYDKTDFDTAATTFKNESWKGSAQYKAGDYEAAYESFSTQSTPEGFYNQGNALAQMGRIDEAIAAYEKALEARPDYPEAKENKALLEKLKDQQEQQQQDQQNQQQQDQQNQQQNGDSQDQQGQGDSQQQDEQSQQQQDGSKPQDEQDNTDGSQSQQQNQDQQHGEENQNNTQQNQQDAQEQQNAEQSQPSRPESAENKKGQEKNEAVAADAELTDEEKEEQQRMENLMRRVPDDPAFLLKRKMQLEAQKRQRQRMPVKGSEW